MQRLRKRAEFLAVRGGSSWVSPYFVLTACRASHGSCRVGFTVSKKVGCAVVRNRVRRRLRALVAGCFESGPVLVGCDYVLVGRALARAAPWDDMMYQMKRALVGISRKLGVSGPYRVPGAPDGVGGSVRRGHL